ncbi:MAG: hypothetical protein ACP5OP_03875 [Leptospirillia bacterium]
MGILPLGSPEVLSGQGEGSYGPLSASATIAPLRPGVQGVAGSSAGDLLQVPLLAPPKPSRSPASVLSGVSSQSEGPHTPYLTTETTSDSGVVSRVLAGIDAVGSTPAEVSVYSQPMGHSIVTDVVVHQIDQGDGTRKIGNHWQSVPAPSPPVSDGIGNAGLRVGAYEESRNAAREAYMMFQGMKLNQIA